MSLNFFWVIMHLLIITGFLGSGKTTLLLRLAELAQKQEKKVAILVNEVGEIGIDNQIMKQLGFNVSELLGGCICCSLAGDVIGTLERVQKKYQPDFVLLEPSGAADPRNLMNILAAYKGIPFKSLIKAAIIDSVRLDMLMKVISPLIITTMEQADLILINKADEASPKELDKAYNIALKYMPSNKIFKVCAHDEIEPDIIRELLPWIV